MVTPNTHNTQNNGIFPFCSLFAHLSAFMMMHHLFSHIANSIWVGFAIINKYALLLLTSNNKKYILLALLVFVHLPHPAALHYTNELLSYLPKHILLIKITMFFSSFFPMLFLLATAYSCIEDIHFRKSVFYSDKKNVYRASSHHHSLLAPLTLTLMPFHYLSLSLPLFYLLSSNECWWISWRVCP